MSEDPTKDIGEKYATNPTLETVVQMLGSLRDEMRSRFDALEVRLDRITSEVRQTQSDFHALRADFVEFRREVREHLHSEVK